MTKIISQTEKEVEESLGETLANDPFRRGRIINDTLLKLGQDAKLRNAAMRRYLSQVYSEHLYKLVRIPVTNPDGSMVTNDDGEIEYVTFSDFRTYFDYITGGSGKGTWNITDKQKLSTLYNGTTKLMAAAKLGVLKNEDGNVITEDDLLELGEYITQRLVAVANRALTPGSENPEDISRAIDIAQQSNTDEDFQRGLRDAGLAGSKTDPFDLYYYQLIGKDTGKVWITAEMTPAQFTMFLLRIGQQVTQKSSDLTEMRDMLDNAEEPDQDDEEDTIWDEFTGRL